MLHLPAFLVCLAVIAILVLIGLPVLLGDINSNPANKKVNSDNKTPLN